MNKLHRCAELRPSEHRLVTLMSSIGFGTISGLHVNDGVPVFEPPPVIQRDVRFGRTEQPPACRSSDRDFTLKREHAELLQLMTRIGEGLIATIEIRHGLPFSAAVTEKLPSMDANR